MTSLLSTQPIVCVDTMPNFNKVDRQHQGTTTSNTADDATLAVCFLCQKKVPTPIANEIVAMAGLFPTYIVQTTVSTPRNIPMVDTEYLRLAVPTYIHQHLQFRKCTSLAIEFSSHKPACDDYDAIMAQYAGVDGGDVGSIYIQVHDASGRTLMPRRHVQSFRPTWPCQILRRIRDRDLLDLLVPGHCVVLFVQSESTDAWAHFSKSARIQFEMTAAVRDSVDTPRLLHNHHRNHSIAKTSQIQARDSIHRQRFKPTFSCAINALVAGMARMCQCYIGFGSSTHQDRASVDSVVNGSS
ncbi:Aste57867_22429 [Aphanomyces stellatus]|uniref:Aste57867_22429 protein n=1 Tax=Aphanomyces stellatus TaxID=120398 RepID=A0A485LLX6_9STRA|nr:hypothetical protein As57867_022359 [Aphanomyces stellatus]VFT99091.1 Aste57867_22429 [Aphanomyces stellatus]